MKRKFSPTVIFFTAVFLFFFVFFIYIHPLFPFDCDDWMYMSFMRWPFPDFREWNPAKVFPEMFFPAVSTFASFTAYPLLGDFFKAQTLVHGFVVSSFATLYISTFYRLITQRFSMGRGTGMALALLFLSLHFLVFMQRSQTNMASTHLFYSQNLNCYYNYIIPNLLNATLVMSLLTHDWLRHNHSTLWEKALVGTVVYLAIFSNLFGAEILPIFLGCQMLFQLPRGKREDVWQYLKDNRLKLLVIAMFCMALAFEYFGARAAADSLNDMSQGHTLSERMVTTIAHIKQLPLNMIFLSLLVVSSLYGSYRVVCAKHIHGMAATLITMFFVTTVYVFLLTSKVRPDYILRADCLYAAFFPLLLLVTLACIDIVRRYPSAIMALPLFLLLLFSRVDKAAGFMDVGAKYGSIDKLRRVDYDVMRQIMEAENRAGNDTVVLVIPKGDASKNNWPYFERTSLGMISNTLYKHGVIRKQLVGKTIIGKPIDQY